MKSLDELASDTVIQRVRDEDKKKAKKLFRRLRDFKKTYAKLHELGIRRSATTIWRWINN